MACSPAHRDIEEMLLERGLEVDHSTLNRQGLAYAPLIERRLRAFRNRIAARCALMGDPPSLLTLPTMQGSSKRAKARDCVALMRRLGFQCFALLGHDRGSYTAFRAPMDHPQLITRLAILDGVPILETLGRCDARFATALWHWFFFAQPDKPERAILADPDAWYGGSPEQMGAEAYEEFRAAIHDPATVHGMVEDYRAGLGIDREHDEAARLAGYRVSCPALILWSRRDDPEQLYDAVLAVWERWTTLREGRGIDCGHHIAVEAPEELANALVSCRARV